MPESDRHSLVGHFQDGGRSKKNGVRHFFQNAVTPEINSRNCTIFGAEEDLGCPFNFAYFDLGVTSRDLSMTFLWEIVTKGILLWILSILALHYL